MSKKKINHLDDKEHKEKKKSRPEISSDHHKHNEYTPSNIESGKEGERYGIQLDKKHMKLNLNHNDLDNNYTNQHGPDFWDDEGLIIGDAKNHSDSYYLNMDWAIELDKKTWTKNTKIKFILASIINSWQVKNYLRKQGWYIIEWGDKLVGQSWKSATANVYKQKDYHEFLKAVKREKLKQRRKQLKHIRKNWVKPNTSLKNNNSVSSFIGYKYSKLSEYTQDSVLDDSKVDNTRYKDKDR